MNHRREIDGTDIWTSRRGDLRTRVLVKGLLLVRFSGDLTDELAAQLTEVLLRAAAEVDRYTVFHDWEEMQNYETASRVRLTNVAMQLKSKTEGVHILVRSQVVAVGVQVANILLKNLTAYTDRGQFEAVLSRVMVAKGATGTRS